MLQSWYRKTAQSLVNMLVLFRHGEFFSYYGILISRMKCNFWQSLNKFCTWGSEPHVQDCFERLIESFYLLFFKACTKTRNTRTPEHSSIPRITGTLNLKVLFCFPNTDHVKKINVDVNVICFLRKTKELRVYVSGAHY